MTWKNAFDVGPCTVEVWRGTTRDYSGVLSKGQSVAITDAFWTGLTLEVSSSGVVALLFASGSVEDLFEVRVLPSFSLSDMDGFRLGLPLSGSSGGTASANDSDTLSFSNGDAAADLSAQVPGNWLAAKTGGIATSPLLLLSPEVNVPDTFPSCDQTVIELWQKPSSAYRLRLRAYAEPKAFSADTDTTSVDARLVFLLALANAKAHYQQADWQQYMNQFQMRLRKLRARAHNNMRYTAGSQWAPPPQPKIKGLDVP